MSGAYDELLDATIQHLEGLKSRGVRNVSVSAETLRALTQPVKPPTSDFAAPVPPAAATASPPAAPTPPRRFSTPVPTPIPAGGRPAPPPAPSTPPPSRPLEPQAKAAAFAALRARVLTCVKCAHLASSAGGYSLVAGSRTVDN